MTADLHAQLGIIGDIARLLPAENPREFLTEQLEMESGLDREPGPLEFPDVEGDYDEIPDDSWRDEIWENEFGSPDSDPLDDELSDVPDDYDYGDDGRYDDVEYPW